MQCEELRNAGWQSRRGGRRGVALPPGARAGEEVAGGVGGAAPLTAAPWRRARRGPAAARDAAAACGRERSDVEVRAVRRRVATGLFHQKAVRSRSTPLCRRLSFGAPDASPAHLAPFSLGTHLTVFLHPSC